VIWLFEENITGYLNHQITKSPNYYMNLEQLRQFKPQIQALAREYKIDPDSIRVFGSVARGDNRMESDIDLLIHPVPPCSIFDISAFFEDVGSLIGKKVDVISDRALRPEFLKNIQDDITSL
jgi:predicted nucleotidyltransferase